MVDLTEQLSRVPPLGCIVPDVVARGELQPLSTFDSSPMGLEKFKRLVTGFLAVGGVAPASVSSFSYNSLRGFVFTVSRVLPVDLDPAVTIFKLGGTCLVFW